MRSLIDNEENKTIFEIMRTLDHFRSDYDHISKISILSGSNHD